MANETRYDIWMRCYPQADENMSEEWELEPMTLRKAKEFCEELETNYADEGWRGHRLYKAKFYPEERRGNKYGLRICELF